MGVVQEQKQEQQQQQEQPNCYFTLIINGTETVITEGVFNSRDGIARITSPGNLYVSRFENIHVRGNNTGSISFNHCTNIHAEGVREISITRCKHVQIEQSGNDFYLTHFA